MMNVASGLEKILIAALCIGGVYLLMITDTSAVALVDMMEAQHGKD